MNAVDPITPIGRTSLRQPIGRREQIATRLVFFTVGLVQGAWAPLVPLARLRLGADDSQLGLLLLCLGLGSMVAMPLTGALAARVGCRSAILVGGVPFILLLPALAWLDTWPGMIIALAVFGASIGTVDVAMNLQAVVVERDSGRPMMSGFHALFSFGGIVGAAGASGLFAAGVGSPVAVAALVSALGLVCLAATAPGLLPYGEASGESHPLFVVPRGAVLLIGVLALLCFLAEGAILDWSAVFLRTVRGADVSLAGLGYAVFAVTMTMGRFAGDWIRAKLGEVRVLVWGGLLSAGGFLITAVVPSSFAGLLGFFLVGAGASNIVPVLFTATGRTTSMPSGLAVASVTTFGYLGILVGPAAIGFVAQQTSLPIAFGLLAAAMLVIGANFRAAKA